MNKFNKFHYKKLPKVLEDAMVVVIEFPVVEVFICVSVKLKHFGLSNHLISHISKHLNKFYCFYFLTPLPKAPLGPSHMNL